MKRLILFFSVIFLISLSAEGQTNFVTGYIVDNAGNKTICSLRNVGVAESADKYEYRLDKRGKVFPMSLAEITEFGIEGRLKCIKALIPVDISPSRIAREEDAQKGPEWDRGHAYLKVLVEGDAASLYSYYSEGTETFYYKTDTVPLTILYHKEYVVDVASGYADKRLSNDTFRSQLAENMPIEGDHSYETLPYVRKPLIRYFSRYNDSRKAAYEVPDYSEPLSSKFVVKLAGNYNMMDLTSTYTGERMEKILFSDKNSIGFGLEFEYVLPFNNHKFSIFAESNFYSYHSEFSTQFVEQSVHDSHPTKMKFVEIPLGVNMFMNLNDRNRFFVKAGYSPSFTQFFLGDSSVTLWSPTPETFSSSGRAFLGAGYNHGRLNLEARYYTGMDVTQGVLFWESDFSHISFRLSYAIIK